MHYCNCYDYSWCCCLDKSSTLTLDPVVLSGFCLRHHHYRLSPPRRQPIDDNLSRFDFIKYTFLRTHELISITAKCTSFCHLLYLQLSRKGLMQCRQTRRNCCRTVDDVRLLIHPESCWYLEHSLQDTDLCGHAR